MKIGILETGEVHPDLKARYGDYPAMFEALLRSADPDARVRRGAGGGRRDAGLAHPGRRLAGHRLAARGLRRPPLDRAAQGVPPRGVAARVPVVGICFGHQILAEALGGRAVKSDKGWGLGVQDYELVARPGWMDGLPDRFSVRALHQDQVVDLPPGATVLARSPHCAYAALAYGDPEAPDAITLQPHPEFGPEFMDELLALRAGTAFPAEAAASARGVAGAPDARTPPGRGFSSPSCAGPRRPRAAA